MAAPSPPPTAKPRRRRTRLLFIPVMLLLLGVVAFVILYIRGTWATTQPRDPASVQEGPISQLYQKPDGNKVVRCAVLLPYSLQRVWTVVTDYPYYSEFLPYLSDVQATQTDDGCVMKGQAASAISGTWPFEIVVHEDKETVPERWRISWDEKPTEGDVQLNSGSWELTPVGENQTLLVLTLQAEVRSSPTFFLRNFFLYRLKQVVRAVEKRLQSQGP
jgi:ribosome-associated toxin RatA of RatAB toxin-antitoxin module